MGYAKYLEDNVEISLQRFEKMNADIQRHITTIAVFPLITIPVTAPIRVRENKQSKPVGPRMNDKILQCRDCGKAFLFSARDQLFFAQRGFSKPKRCKACRESHVVRMVAFGR